MSDSRAPVPHHCRSATCGYCNVRIDSLCWTLDGPYATLTAELDRYPGELVPLVCGPDQFLFLAPFLTQPPLDGRLTLPLTEDEDGTIGIDWTGALEQYQLCTDELRARTVAPAALIAPPKRAPCPAHA
jgi:hypothetical protein